MEKGLESVFPTNHGQNIHLRCFDHMTDDFKRKLDQLKIPKESQTQIIQSILGSEFGGKRNKGLVDLEGDKFDSRLKLLEKSWPSAFTSYLHSKTGRIRTIIETLKECMSTNVRVSAGLGNPPNKWTNQRAESMNSILKEELGSQETDLVNLHELLYKRVAEQQETELTKAIFKMGEYRLSDMFKHFEVDPSVWCQKGASQREAYIKKVFGKTSSKKGSTSGSKLSITKEKSNLSDLVPTYLLGEIWAKAEEILSGDTKCIPMATKMCVIDSDKAFTLNVEDGIVKKCTCTMFLQTNCICQHLLVAGDSLKCLSKMFLFIKQKRKPSRSFVGKAQKNAGRKPGQSKRKGKNNIPTTPIVESIDGHTEIDKPIHFQYDKYYHSDEPFHVEFLSDYKKAKKCAGCEIMFRKVDVEEPHDLVILHQERYEYPDGDGGYKVTRCKTRNVFYCINVECIKTRHPYFWKGRVVVAEEIRKRLSASHKMFITDRLHVEVD
jgi:hypothetical protein